MTSHNRNKTQATEDKVSKPKIKRSRNGCHNCKRLKIKCNEGKPTCSYCIKAGIKCDYSIKLTWGGRPYKDTGRRVKGSYGTKISATGGKQECRSKSELKENKAEGDIRFVTEDNETWRDSVGPLTPQPGNAEEFASKKPDINMGFDVFASSKQNISFYGLNSPKQSNIFESSNPLNSFTTPKGQSILSPHNDFPDDSHTLESSSLKIGLNETQDIGRSNTDDMIHASINNDMNSENNPASIIDNIPELSDGIESVSNALGRISNGGFHFNLKDSEIFNNFVFSNFEDKNSRGTTYGIDNIVDSELNMSLPNGVDGLHNRDEKLERIFPKAEIDEDAFDNYSADLAKIELYLPEKQQSNLLNEFLSPGNPIGLLLYNIGSTKRIKELTDDEDDLLSSLNEENNDLIKTFGIPKHSDDEKQILTPEDIFLSIPPLLTPLPEILLEVPFYRNLLHFWVNVASDNLVPAPSYIYKDNPFKVLLPQMAMECPAILTTLLALSSSFRSLLIGSDDIPKIVIDQLLARSCRELLKLLKDKHEATSNATLATVLLLSCYECFTSSNFERHRAHALGARQIIMARRLSLPVRGGSTSPESDNSTASSSESQGSSNSNSIGSEGDIAFFLMRWFLYMDVMSALSATKNSHNYLASDNGHYEPTESVEIMCDFDTDFIDRKKDIDHLLGFDIRVLPQLKDIALLIRKTDTYMREPGSNRDSLPLSITVKALEVKETITRAYETGEARRQAKRQARLDRIMVDGVNNNDESHIPEPPTKFSNIVQHYNILRSTNKIFCDMGILNLYRRVLLIPRDSPLVQNLADGIGKILETNLEPLSSAEICSIFCMFCAGCETLNPSMRTLFYNRFSSLGQMGNINAKKGLQIMTRCWETGEDWIDASKKLDIDMALL